jgi:hypothetical protein
VQAGEADLFLWEVFTTKPWFDSGELKYIGEISTPWPAFSIVSSPNFAADETSAHIYKHRFLPALSEGVQLFLRSQETLPANQQGWGHQNVLGEGIRSSGLTAAERIAKDFGHKEEDARRWLQTNRYSPRMDVNVSSLQKAAQILQQVGLVPLDFSLPTLWGGDENKAISFAPTTVAHLTEDHPARSLEAEDR